MRTSHQTPHSASTVLLGMALVACGCGGDPAPLSQPVTPATLVTVPAPQPPPPPPLPPEPARLTAIAAPPSVCTIDGAIGEDALDLGGRADAPGFMTISAGKAKVTVGPAGEMFAEVATPGLTVRGLVRGAPTVRASTWLSFGGVYFPGASAAVSVKEAHDDKLQVTAEPVPGFTLAEGSRNADLSCASASLETDATGTLARDLPAPFQPKGATKLMYLKPKTAVPISADPGGAVAGTFDAADAQQSVTLLETRGAQARIRRAHVAGWVDTKLLVAPKKTKDERVNALLDGAEFGMIGLLSSGESPPPPEDAAKPLVCTADVRVVAEASSGAARERYVVGKIPAGQPLHVGATTDELATLVVDPAGIMRLRAGYRLAVPTRDLVACSSDTRATAPRTASNDHVVGKQDAIDALDPPSLWARAGIIGDSFGAGGLGLSGVGVGAGGRGEGIGLGNIGTTGRPTGQGFGNPHSNASLRQGATQVNGRLPPEVIQRIVRQNFGRFRLCYENGLRTNPSLQGRVSVKFVIDENGNVKTAGDGGSDLPDNAVVRCVVRGFSNLSFPQPESGIVTVVYPIIFSPGTPATPPKKP